MKKRIRLHQEGMALVAVMLAAVIIFGAVTLVVAKVQTTKRFTDVAVQRVIAEEAAKGAIDDGISQVWGAYVQANGGPGNLVSYLAFMDNIVPTNEDLNGNGMQDAEEADANGNGIFDTAAPTYLVTGDAPKSLAGGGSIQSLTLARTDTLTGTTITMQATAQNGAETSTATQTMQISGQMFAGFDYGILANNINCILCHADIQPLDLAMNTDSSLYGTFQRIKMGALESLLISKMGGTFNANSEIAGTTYTRGSVYDHNGNALSASGIAGSTFKSYDFDNTTGQLQQNSSGTMTQTDLQSAGLDPDGLPVANANLYMDYPTDPAEMTDGELPTSFPAPFGDYNDNKIVDDAEFGDVTNTANGAITGGVIHGVPDGSTYAGTGLPTTSNGAAASLASGTYSGNLILVGTDADPIVINDRIAIDGDLVIAGKVKGWGQLQVRGNTYIVGDTTYADAPGQFGVAVDGTENGLAIVSGNSILMGDYLTRMGKDNPSTGSHFGEYQIDMRNATSVQGSGGSARDAGFFSNDATDPGWKENGEKYTSFTTTELMLFNKMENQKATADPTYTPRYYQLRPSQPIYEYVGSGPHSTSYTKPGVQQIADLAGAAILSLNPNNFWISETQLREIYFADELTRPSSGRPFQFDGLLYSNNAIFSITRSNQFHNSNTMGQATLRGSIISPDLGMLIPGADLSSSKDALKLFYDRRVSAFFQIADTSQVEFARTVFLYN